MAAATAATPNDVMNALPITRMLRACCTVFTARRLHMAQSRQSRANILSKRLSISPEFFHSPRAARCYFSLIYRTKRKNGRSKRVEVAIVADSQHLQTCAEK